MRSTDVEVQCEIYRDDGVSWCLSVPCNVSGRHVPAGRHSPPEYPEVEVLWDSITIDEGWQDVSDDGDDPQPLTTPDDLQYTAEERAAIEERCMDRAPKVAQEWTDDAREDARRDAAEARLEREWDR